MKNSNLIYGILFAILGFFCILYPAFSTLWLEIMVGLGLFAGAIFTFMLLPRQRDFSGKAFYALLGVLYAAGGVFIVANPVQGAAALMTALGFIFIFEGLLVLMWLSKMKAAPRVFKGMSLLNGIVTLVLGVLVLLNPSAGMWFIGTLVGIDLLFTGLSMAFSPRAQ